MKLHIGRGTQLLTFVAVCLAFFSACAPTIFSVGGTAIGLGGPVTLTLNDAEDLNVTQNGSFRFATKLSDGATYTATITSHGQNQRCSITNASGVIAAAAVTNISISCNALAPPSISSVTPTVVLSGYEVVVSGTNLADTSIALDGEEIDATQRHSNELRFIAPPNTRGFHTLAVTNIDGNSTIEIGQGEALTGVEKISAGDGQTCALTNVGEIKCWGLNGHGALGSDFSGTKSAQPVTISGLQDAIAVSSGEGYSCATLRNGQVQCWGYNYDGQLGDGTTQDSAVPVIVSGINNAVSTSVATYDSCALLATGSVKCWGDTISDAPHFPQPMSDLNIAVGVSRGKYSGNVLLSSGQVAQLWTWDFVISNVENAIAIDAGAQHGCALLGTGEIKCWGNNTFGQLGNGTNTSNLGGLDSPIIATSVIGINNAIAISSGDRHSCALLQTGTVKCWGNNLSGQLGNGTVANSYTPVDVVGLHDAIAISAGSDHNCALLANKSVRCWGANWGSQLGLSGNTSITKPAYPVHYLP